MIKVININTEPYKDKPNFHYIGRGSFSILGNPYSHLPEDKCKATFKCQSREEAIQKYDEYFDIMYGHNVAFTEEVDKIYEEYKSGKDVYLGCFCKPKPCHGDIIKKKLEERLFKEKLQEIKK